MKMVLETESSRPYRNIDAAQCPGCPSNLATKLVMEIVFQFCQERGQQPVIFGQGCGIGRNILQRSGIGTHDSGCVGLKAAMELRGIDRPLVVVDGDGQIDMGFDDFSGGFQYGARYLHIICDNQSFAASGTHATGMTDMFAKVSTRPTGRVGGPSGRVMVRKQPAIMIRFSGARYSATASPVHIRDFERKLLAALDNLPAFIQIFTPCNLSWGYDDSASYRVTKLGVDCGIWPLWEWSDEIGFRRTHRIDRGKIHSTLREYVGLQRRYSHLTDDEFALMERYVIELNDMIDRMEKAFPPRVPASNQLVR